jgi:single-stranded DNA-binding protein
MHCQLHLSARLTNDLELSETKKGRLMVRLLLETSLVRETTPGNYQTETVLLPVSLFSGPAEQVKGLHQGDTLSLGCHLYGSEFTTSEGVVKRGVQIIADAVFFNF